MGQVLLLSRASPVRMRILALGLLLFGACRAPPQPDDAPAAPPSTPAAVSVWLTTSDHAKALSAMPAAHFSTRAPLPLRRRVPGLR